MRKLIGAAVILMASFLAALLRLRSKTERIRLLRALETSLLELRSELAERQRGLGEIFHSLSQKSGEEAVESFYVKLYTGLETLGERGFAEIWRTAAESSFVSMVERCFDALLSLGGCLGGSELDRQCAALEATARRIAETARAEQETLGTERRLSFGLSLSLGAFLVIILM